MATKTRLVLIAFCLALAMPNAGFGQLDGFKRKQTAEEMLTRARSALAEGKLDLAEFYVNGAEKLQVEYGSVFSKFSDSPEQVREAIRFQRVAMQNGAPAASNPVALSGLDGTAILPGATKADALALLERSKAALDAGDMPRAIRWYKSAAALRQEFSPDEFSPRTMYEELVAKGVNPAELRSSTPGTTQLPPPGFGDKATPVTVAGRTPIQDTLTDPQSVAVNDGDSISTSSLLERAVQIKATEKEVAEREYKSERQRVMQLLAQAQAALDRDEVDLAEQYAFRAQEIRLPEAAFQAGDTRPWMVLMEISKAQRRVAPREQIAGNTIQAPTTPDRIHNGPDLSPATTNMPVVVHQSGGLDPATNQFIQAQRAAAFTQTPQQQPIQQAYAISSSSAIGTPPGGPDERPQVVVNNTVPNNNVALTQGLEELQPPDSSFGTANVFPNAGELASPTPAQMPSDLEVAAPPLEPTSQSTTPEPVSAAPQTPVATSPQTIEVSDIASDGPTPAGSSTNQSDPNPIPTEAPAPEENIGVQIYRQGIAALGQGDLEEAEGLFREAWKYEASIDEANRQSLQDHLQFVRQQLVRQTQPNRLSPEEGTPNLLATPSRDTASDEIARELNDDGNVEKKAALERLLSDIARRQVAVQAMKASEPKKAWDEFNLLREQIVRAKIEEEPREQLLRRMDRQIGELEDYIERNRGRIENDDRNRQILAEIDRRRELKTRNQQKLADMVEQFNSLMDEQRFPEAIIIAKKARELDPLNPVVENMVFKSQTARQIRSQMLRDDRFRAGALASFDAIDEAAVAPENEWGIEFPRYWDDLTKSRQKYLADRQRRYTDVEMEIQKSLKKQVEVQFDNAPLSVVLEKLAQMADVNVYIDPEGLSAEGLTSDTLVSINLRQPVMLKSALNLILEPLHLSYIVQDEVLRITSEQVKDGDVYTETYNVADLVIPIPNFVPSYNIGLPGAIREAHRVLGEGYLGGAMNHQPMTLMAENPGMGPNSNNASVLAQMGASGMLPSSMGVPSGHYGPAGAGGGSQADFDTLIELITATIEPDTWEEVGGPGAIDGFPGNLSLVVSQTQDVHERIVDLLEQLRRLQDLQVTIEVRFIELNDDFFERIGIDFDFDIEDGTGLASTDVAPGVDEGPNVTVGLQQGTMTPTLNLDIPFRQGSFDAAVPAFGGFTPDAAANIGFAILSDIEAYFMIQASQGDTRSNILTAPKVTLFNGQTAFVSATSQRPFVTSVIPVVGDFAAAHQPVITVLTEGTSLSVQAVVSQDRRFIRLTLVPFFSQIGDVDTFTFDGVTTSDTGTTTVDPTDNSSVVNNNVQRTVQGTTVQLPTFSFTTVNTTVSVPDGGTILLGGIKSLQEGRNERGVPMLSKLPYINRLFKNVGIGRDSRSLMMMVTPRIIIQEEQEELQLGISSGP